MSTEITELVAALDRDDEIGEWDFVADALACRAPLIARAVELASGSLGAEERALLRAGIARAIERDSEIERRARAELGEIGAALAALAAGRRAAHAYRGHHSDEGAALRRA